MQATSCSPRATSSSPAVVAAEVLEEQRDPVLHEGAEAHAHDHLVERGELGEVLAGAARRDEGQAPAQLAEDLGRVVAQEHLAAAALPADVVHVVDVADQVGLLEADHVAVLIRPHERPPRAPRTRAGARRGAR